MSFMHVGQLYTKNENTWFCFGPRMRDVSGKSRSVNPLSEQDSRIRVRPDRGAVAQLARAYHIVIQLDVICDNDVCQHGFQFVCSKEASGTSR